MNCWVLVYPKHLQDLAKDLVATMESTCGPLGMHVSRPAVVQLKDDRIETYAKAIRSVLGCEVRRGGAGQVVGELWSRWIFWDPCAVFAGRRRCSCCSA